MNGIFLDGNPCGLLLGLHRPGDSVTHRNYYFADISQQNEKSVGRIDFAWVHILRYPLVVYDDT